MYKIFQNTELFQIYQSLLKLDQKEQPKSVLKIKIAEQTLKITSEGIQAA